MTGEKDSNTTDKAGGLGGSRKRKRIDDGKS